MNGATQFSTLCAVLLSLLIVTGCKSLVTVPIDDHSYIGLAGDPFSETYLTVSYNWVQPKPGPKALPTWNARKWNTEIRLDGLGTLYSSKRDDSPALQRIELAWHLIREEDRYGMSALEDLSQGRKVSSEAEAKRTKRREEIAVSKYPALQLPLSMFSVRPRW